jgi:galactokinase
MVPRELSNSKYSERVDEYNAIKQIVADQGRPDLRQIASSEIDGLLASTRENLLKRARHIVSENERTLKAFECLRGGQVLELGRLLLETHRSLSEDYEVSHPNLDFLVATAQKVVGVAGGRMMGGGFGGCCLFLVGKSQEEEFCRWIADEYEAFSDLKTHPRPVEFVDGASAWTHGN